jgi:membrane-bound lytic murein transglycosylase D
MLKTKLHKAGFIITSFMLMAAASGNKYIPVPGDFAVINKTIIRDSIFTGEHIFDAEGLCVCLPEMNANELNDAPRIQLNEQAADFVQNHLKENGLYYDKIKAKNASKFTLIEDIFQQYNIPVELKYLAVVESKLDNRIVSSAGAAGLWQFMPVAAKSFGLKVSGKNDERKHNYKSTVAAAKCLIYLHNMFDDWLLTLAAYNSGPARVLSAIKKSGSRDFWVLQNYLPVETRKHVKKFISVHYHFEGHGSLATLTKTETKAHTDAVAAFIAKHKEPVITDSLATGAETVKISN